MSDHIPVKEKIHVLDRFSQKMTNSGRCLAVVRRIMVSGLKGHIRKVARCVKEGKPFHRTAAASAEKVNSKTILVQKQTRE